MGAGQDDLGDRVGPVINYELSITNYQLRIMKIKKYILPIILLVMLVGIFVPALGVQAIGIDPDVDEFNRSTDGEDYNFTGTYNPSSSVGTSTPCLALGGLGKLICQLQQILNSIIPVLVLLGVVYFIWGVVFYVIADGEEAKKKGKDRIIYGIIGFVVIVGFKGLVDIVVKTFSLSGAVAPSLSRVAISGASCSLAGSPKFQDVLCYITGIINNSIIPLIFAVATVMFVWGIVQFFILNADEEKKREQGKQFILWGIIALAVMLSVWGLVGILGSTFNVNTSVLPQVSPSR